MMLFLVCVLLLTTSPLSFEGFPESLAWDVVGASWPRVGTQNGSDFRLGLRNIRSHFRMEMFSSKAI